MKRMFAGLILSAAMALFAGQADAGCIKGAIVGGVAGHLAGHGKAGAAAGCVISHHNDKKKQDAQQKQG